MKNKKVLSIDQRLQSKFDSNMAKAMVNVMYTGSWLGLRNTQLLKPFGVSTQQYNVLRILKGFEDWMTMNNIKSRMIDQTPNMTRLTDKLLDKKLIERQRCDKDRRVVYVQITKSGLKLLDEIDVLANQSWQKMKDNLTEEEGKLLSDLLDKLRSE